MKQDKKKLYESIMASVAKEVRKSLNENITIEEIESLDAIEPFSFENDREEMWYNVGLRDGLDAAKDRLKEKGLNWEELLK